MVSSKRPGERPLRRSTGPRSIAGIIWEREGDMSDLKKYIQNRKGKDRPFANGFDVGYEEFKIGVMLRQAREDAGITQEELAQKLKTQKTAISRIENHAEDIKLSTLGKVALALGKRVRISIA
jgi:ribosome-binding protein aMBF1 (putative translation factor)